MAKSAAPTVGSIFGGVLQRFRLAAGLTQEELAYRASVDRTYISRIERGVRQPTITTLLGLGAALEISAADLVREVEAIWSRETVRIAQRETAKTPRRVSNRRDSRQKI